MPIRTPAPAAAAHRPAEAGHRGGPLRLGRCVGLVLAGGLVATIAGCGADVTSSPTDPASLSPTAAATGTPGPSPSDGPAVGQSDTAWGRIWDELPPSFPRLPRAVPANVGEGPVTAELLLPGEAADNVVSLSAVLRAAGLEPFDVSSPLEDGSQVIDGGDGDCRYQIVIAPLDFETLLTIRYGAGCPFEGP